MAQDESKSKPIIVSGDEDWKEKVKAEDAALDQKLAAEGTQTAASQSSSTLEKGAVTSERGKIPPLPEPTFETIVALLSTQAMVALGLVPNPGSGKMESQFELAKHFIDMLAVLQEKTRTNLLGREADLLENSLHQLRLAYVELTKQEKD